MTLDRRQFLVAGGTTLLGAALAACSGETKPSTKVPTTLAELTKGKSNTISPQVVQPLLKRSRDRLALGLVGVPGSDKAGQPYTGGTATAYLAKTQQDPFIKVPLDYVGEGFTAGVYVARISLPSDGDWLVYVEAKPEGATKTLTGGTTSTIGQVPTGASGKPQPLPGDTAISVATPTTTNAGGVNPICTRKPACTMHAISLDQALKSKKLTVLTIGTPAFCETRFCGPLVDQLMKVQATHKAKANFVHIELYKDDKEAVAKQILSPAAKAWRTELEPVTYYIRPNGKIADWTLGASDAGEMTQIIETLTGA